MIMHRSFDELKKAIEKMEKEGNLPLVLFFWEGIIKDRSNLDNS